MAVYQITESVAGNIVRMRSNHPINALKRYIKENVLVNVDNDSWNFDFEIVNVSKCKPDRAIYITEPQRIH